MGQFVHQQNIEIFRRLRGAQTDNNEARREKLLKLLAAEEAKIIAPSRHVCPRDRSAQKRANAVAIKYSMTVLLFGVPWMHDQWLLCRAPNDLC